MNHQQKMKVYIYGNGWIGNILEKYLNESGHFALIQKDCIGCIPYKLIESSISHADVIINTAAKTNIDWCETHKLEAFKNNVSVAVELAESCKRLNKKYVFFSSACVFESKDSEDYKYEDSQPNPACFYSLTKWIAEELIKEVNPDALIIRPRLPISEVPHPRNTINKILKYNKLHTNKESVTVIEDMLPVLKDLIERDEKGVFNMVNGGTISPADIADYFGHWYEVMSKDDERKMMKQEGRARRVTTLVASKRIPYLPDLSKRMPDLVKKYKEHAANSTKSTE